MKKRVCIVGAGPAGLVGAKVLLKSDQFDVTIFEKSHRLGGIWAIDKHTPDGWLNADTPTNLSKFSVGFSDLQWPTSFRSTEDAQHGQEESTSRTSMFPKAWQVNRYLESYRKRYLPDHCLKFDQEVIKSERIHASTSNCKVIWRITTRTSTMEEETNDFDFLLLGTGFFSKPRAVEHAISEYHHLTSPLDVKTVHSSQYRSLQDILPVSATTKGKTILLIGGGNSAGESAAAIAQSLSDSEHSPLIDENDRYRDFKIVHVTPRPLYALPPYHSVDDEYRTFVPLDFRFYDLSKRPEGPIVAGAGRQPQWLKDMMHASLQSILAGDQSELGSAALTAPTSEPRSAVMVALTETYSEYVRSGSIAALRGRVTALENADDGTVTASVRTADGEINVTQIAAVVHATGYSPIAAIDFLPEDVKQALSFDPGSVRLPLILEGWQTMTKDIPDLALLGIYEGPYWGVMEMQARFTAARWLGETEVPHLAYEDKAKLLDLRAGMLDRESDVPQYWFGDYLGYLEEIATHLNLKRLDGLFGEREGCTSPARYLSADSDEAQAQLIMKDLHEVWQACVDEGRFVPRAAFRALQGNWKIQRTIDSALSSFPSGTLDGTASFHPRSPTPDKSGQEFDLEYLYIESGILRMSNGASMVAKRRYVYRYVEADDQLSVWFVKPDSDLEVDYLFHNLQFTPPEEARKRGACIAKADHLCVDDMYWTEYRLPIKGVSLLEFETEHTVKGPSKDYVARTRYTRDR